MAGIAQPLNSHGSASMAMVWSGDDVKGTVPSRHASAGGRDRDRSAPGACARLLRCQTRRLVGAAWGPRRPRAVFSSVPAAWALRARLDDAEQWAALAN